MAGLRITLSLLFGNFDFPYLHTCFMAKVSFSQIGVNSGHHYLNVNFITLFHIFSDVIVIYFNVIVAIMSYAISNYHKVFKMLHHFHKVHSPRSTRSPISTDLFFQFSYFRYFDNLFLQ